METGWYAAIIRGRIKRKLHVRVGTNLTLRIQGRILLLSSLLSTADEARGRVAWHLILPRNVMQAVNKIHIFYYGLCRFNFSIICQKSPEFIGMHSFVFILTCIWSILVSVHTYECNYAYMNVWVHAVTGQWGIEFGWWGMGWSLGEDWWGMGEQEQGGGWRRIMMHKGYEQ